MNYVQIVCSILALSLLAQTVSADSNCSLAGFDLSSLSGDWQTVGYETCSGCLSNVYINLSICSPLQDLTCGAGVSVCYQNILLESVTSRGVPAGSFSSRRVQYNNDNRTMEIAFDYSLQNQQGTTTIVLFCGKHLGVPIVTDSSIESSHMLIEWETNLLCRTAHLAENKCYLVLYDYAYFVPFLYDFTPLIRSSGAYTVTASGGSGSYALNLCQEIVPGTDGSLDGCEGSVLCELSSAGNRKLVLAGGTEGLQTAGGVISIEYASAPGNQSQCNGDAVLSIFFHCPHEFDISPGPRLIVRDSVCYFHVDWYSDHACAQRYSKSEGCVIEGTPSNPFRFDLSPLGTELHSVQGTNYNYEFKICSQAGLQCGSSTAKVCQRSAGGAWNLGSDEGELHYADGELTLSYHHGDTCSSNYHRTSTFRFICAQNSSLAPRFIEEEYCSYFFEWQTPLACISGTTQIGSCQNISFGQSRYDLSYLKRGQEDNWVAGVGAYLSEETSSRFLLNLCGSLNSGGSDQSSAPQACVGYGACEIKDSGDAFGIGKFDRVQARAGNVLVAEYREGVCPNSSKEARVNLVIICKIGVTDSSPVYVGMLEECFYEFQWEHTAACPTSNHITYGQDCKVRDPATLYTYNLSPLSNKLYSTVSNGYQYSLYICSKGNSTGDQCGDAGACQTKDSSSHSLGDLNSTLSFANGSLQLRYVGGDTCSGGVRRSTLVSFACDLNSTGIKEVADPEVSHCSYFFVFYTDKACPFEYLFVDCSYTDSSTGHTYDLSPLIRQFDNWNGTASSSAGSVLSGARFYLNLCRPVNNVPGCNPLSSACMRIQVGGDTKWVSIGRPTTGLRALGGSARNGLRVVYSEEEPLDLSGVCNAAAPQTAITFFCPQSSETARLDYPRLIAVDTGGCVFEFEWYTRLACADTEIPASAPCTATDPATGFVFSFLSLTGTTRVLLEDASDASPFFYLSICSTVDSDILLSSSTSSEAGAVLLYPSAESGAKNSSVGRANQNIFYSDGDLMQLWYTEGAPCPNGKKSTLITFVCSHQVTSSVYYIGSLPIPSDNCLFEFDYNTILACPPIITECTVSSSAGLTYDLTRLKQLSATGFPVSISGQNTYIPASASLKISVCQPLEAGSTGGCGNGSASCLSYGDQRFDLGRVTGDLQLSELGELQLIYSGGTGCSDSALTVVTFHCDETVGVGQPLLSLLRNASGSCYYGIVWDTAYACPVRASEESACAVTDTDTGFVYNFTSLKNLPDLHLEPNASSGDQYFYTLSICRPISSSCGEGSPRAGACQISADSQFVTGLYNSTLIFEEGEVRLVYSGGQRCHTNNVTRTTVIRFYCDRTAAAPRAVVLPELSHCLYEILLYTSLACPPRQPAFQCTAYSAETGDSYDLSSLQYRRYYTVYWGDDVVFFFSVCRALPSLYGDKGAQCPSGSSFCALHRDSSDSEWKATDLGRMTEAPFLIENNIIVLHYSSATSNTSVFLDCPGEGQSAGFPTLLRSSQGFSTNLFYWSSLAACRSAASDSCQVVQYSTGFTIDLDHFRVASIDSETSDVGGSLSLSLCGPLTNASLDSCSNNKTAVCLTKGGKHYPIATDITSKWFYGDEIVVSYYDGYNCLDSSSPFKSSVELTLLCGPTQLQTVQERSEQCVYQVLWETPVLCQYQVECRVTHGGQDYDLNWLKAYDNNWIVNFNGDRFLINVCHNLLPDGSQECNSTAAICMLSGDKVVSLGQVSEGPEYVGEGILKIDYWDGDVCGDERYSSSIVFNCQKGADLEDYITQESHGCHYTFTWATHVACASTEGSSFGVCKIENNVTGDVYDLAPVSALGSVSVSNAPLIEVIACQVIQGDCQGSVCYNRTISYGAYNEKVGLKLKDNVPILEYSGGSPCGGGDSKYQSRIEFVCNKSAVDHSYVEHLPIEGCHQYFLWHTPLACASTVTECELTVGGKVVDITDLNRKYTPWEVAVTDETLYFNPCDGMSWFLAHTELKSESCSSDSLACLLQDNVLREVGGLDTAVLMTSTDGKYPIETARSQTKCRIDKSKTFSVKILFYSGSTMVGTPVFEGTQDTKSSCVVSIIFSTSLVGQESPLNARGELETTGKPGTCHDALVRLNKDKDYHVKSDHADFYINFCSYASDGGCEGVSVCAVLTEGSNSPYPLGLSSYQKQRVKVINESYIELIMSSANRSCPLTDKHILTLFYISCEAKYAEVAIAFLFTAPTGCIYAFSVQAPPSVCLSYEPTDAPVEDNLNSSGKTAVVFIIVLIVCLLGIFLSILVTLCFYKRSKKGDRVFWKLRAYLSRVPDVQYRFQKIDGSEVGHLITNMSGSESDDETNSEERLAAANVEPAPSDKFAISGPSAGRDDSEDEDFIKL